jgi:hypothetical protein
MKYLSWALRILLFLLLLGFVLKNTAPVTVYFYLGSQWQASLAVVLLVCFAVANGASPGACEWWGGRRPRRPRMRAEPAFAAGRPMMRPGA